MKQSGMKKQTIQTIAKIFFSAVVLYFLFRKCDWPSLLSALGHADVGLVLLAFLAVQGTHVIAAARWGLLCRKAKFLPLFKLVYVSRLY